MAFFALSGGASSKSEEGATITTPVGTAGIRGAIVDIFATGQNGLPPGVSLVFGSALSMSLTSGEQQLVTEPGQTIFVTNGSASIAATPPQLAAQFVNVITNAGGAGSAPVGSAQVVQAIQSLPAQQGLPGGAGAADTSNAFAALNQAISTVIGAAQASDNAQAGTEDRITSTAPSTGGQPDPSETAGEFQGNGFGIGTGVGMGPEGPVPIPRSAAVTISLNPSDMTVQGTFEGDFPSEQNVFSFEPEDSTVDFGGTFSASNEQGTLQSSSELLCDECDFMEWGTWSTTASAPEQIENGHWVLGDPTTAQQIEGLTGTASYAGNAVGYATGSGVTGLADGTFTANMDFGSGSGWIEFEDFGHQDAGRRDFDVTIDLDETGSNFRADIFSDPSESNAIDGDLWGGFANDANGPAQGILGAFEVTSSPIGPDPIDWTATGVFAGTRQP